MSNTLVSLLIAFLLLAANAFYVAAEFALVKSKSYRIDNLAKEGRFGAALTQRMLHNVEAYLAVCQLGITMASLGLGWFAQIRAVLWDGRYSLITVALAAFGRSVAEVGAVIIVGGNIEHLTRVMTTAIALETSKGNLSLAVALGIVLLAIALIVNGFVREVIQELPMEFAVEAQKLINISLEGSVG